MTIQTHDCEEEVSSTDSAFGETELMKKLPALLRVVGAAALLIAMYSFLAKGWQSGNDVFRYLMMLGHTGLLASIGLMSGHWFKESKGARLLLTLALVSVPANFAILGAFILSGTSPDVVSYYPQYLAWTVESLPIALYTGAGAMVILVPITLLGFTVLARSMSRRLSLLFLISNAALLLPLRDAHTIGLVVIILTVCTFMFSRKAAYKQSSAKTHEGIIALGLQFLPLAVLLGRSLWLHSYDLFLLTVLAVAVFFVLRQVSLYLEPGAMPRNVLDILSLVPAVSMSVLWGTALSEARMLPADLALPLGVIASSLMVYDIARRSHDHGVVYRRVAVGIVLAGLIGNLMLFSSALATAACVATGLLLSARGYKAQQRSVFTGGIILFITGLIYQFYDLVHYFDLGSWASMALLGMALIVIASAIESQGGKIRSRLADWRSSYRQWEK